MPLALAVKATLAGNVVPSSAGQVYVKVTLPPPAPMLLGPTSVPVMPAARAAHDVDHGRGRRADVVTVSAADTVIWIVIVSPFFTSVGVAVTLVVVAIHRPGGIVVIDVVAVLLEVTFWHWKPQWPGSGRCCPRVSVSIRSPR